MVHEAESRLSSRRASLSAEQRRWLLINALAVPVVINAVLNWLIARASVDDGELVPLWSAGGEPSVITDSLGTLFVLPLLTTLLVTTIVWRELRSGGLEPVERLDFPLELPEKRLLRGLAFGALTLAIFGPPVAAALAIGDAGDLTEDGFAAYKAAFGVILGAIVTPVIAVRAMADPA